MERAPLNPRKVLIVDDEVPARAFLRELVSAHPELRIVGEAAHGLEAVELARTARPDLVFLDVQMPKLDGFEVLELLDPEIAVVFTTAHDQYALRAFEVNAVDYLLKPFTEARFEEALRRSERRLAAGAPPARALAAAARPPGTWASRIVIRDGPRIELLAVGDLDYARAQGDYVELVHGDRSWLKEQTLHDLEASLDPARFVRVHRSYLLQCDRLVRIEPATRDSRVAVLTSGARIPVSEAGSTRLQEWLTRAGR
jgi:two-component system LytT family response regulator